MKCNAKKILSLLLALSVICSCFAGISITASAETDTNAIIDAAKAYVIANKNNSTATGLLNAVKSIDSSITLDAANDFFIKHAVPGVRDVMADGSENLYPLDIKGSDGAVAAVFKRNGTNISFAIPFAHEVETIEISKVAVAGVDEGFTYSKNQTLTQDSVSYTWEEIITGYTGGADKIVLPEGYKGTIAMGLSSNQGSDSDAYGKNGIEVLIINNTEPMYRSACEGWDDLKAVQFAETTPETAWKLYNNPSASNYGRIFTHCHFLKYVKLPTYVKQSWEEAPILPSLAFCQCWRLENINLPIATSDFSLAYRTFDGVIVKDFFLPQHYSYVQNPASWNWVFNGNGAEKTYGYPQIIKYDVDMTTVRAAALAAAKVNELKADGQTVTEEAVESVITNAINAEEIKNNMTVVAQGALNDDYYFGDAVDITVNGQLFTVGEKRCKTLLNLSTSPWNLTSAFNPSVTEYTVNVPNVVTEITVNATAADGAVIGTVTGNTDLAEGANNVIIPVTNTDGKVINYTITVNRESAINPAIIAAAENYVKANKNTVTSEGLLAAVHEVDNSVTLNETDFYIKHAVPGVKDDTTDYPLDIKGSDGAVAAVFGWNGTRYGFTCAFAHETETINITETAVAGTSEGFTYDESGNVTAYNGTADKIVFPAGYTGTMTELADKTAAQNVKVLIYNNGVAFLSKAFNNWDGLIAVQIDNGSNSFLLASAVNSKREDHMFSGCDNLKYFKFPQKVNNSYYWSAMFPNSFLENCAKLETLIMPLEVTSGSFNTYGYHTFYGTAVRDFVMPTCNKNATISDSQEVSGDSQAYGGITNFHHYRDAMTFTRAMALAAAVVNELDPENTNEQAIYNAAISAIKGSADAQTFAEKLDFAVTKPLTSNNYGISFEAIVMNGSDIIPLSINLSRTLTNLTTNYGLTPAFDSSITAYEITIPAVADSVDVIAVPAEGANVGAITGNTGISGETAVIRIPVTVGQTTITYTINVSKRKKLSTEANNAAIAYVNDKQNDVTFDGLIQAVKTVYPQASLAQDDFYIKHAVNGVKDNDKVSGYPLNIEGSDGSVTAIFNIDGEKYSFNTVFAHETERLEIGSYAIVGDSNFADCFTYDENGNVTALNKPVEKLIFPTGYTGTMKKLADEESKINADRVKAVIYNCNVGLFSNAFSEWQGLIAVQMDNGENSLQLASAVNNTREIRMFEKNPSLKYFKFPNVINNSYYWNAMFPNYFFDGCSKLETVIMPQKATSGAPYEIYGSGVFHGTAVREIQWPYYGNNTVGDSGNEMYDSPTFTEGTRNINYPTDAMTGVRAISLISAELSRIGAENSESIIAAAKASITGTNDSKAFADKMNLVWNEKSADDYSVKGELVLIGDDFDSCISADLSKTLSELTVDGKSVDFDSKKLNYTVVTDYLTSFLDISAVAAAGAEISVDNNIADNTATITVTSTDGKQIVYTVNVERSGEVTADVLAVIKKGLLGVDGGIEIDMNVDNAFNIRDLIRAKKNAANSNQISAGNIPLVAASKYLITADEAVSAFGYVDEQGKITDTMFDSIGFRPTTDWMYAYSGETTARRNTTKRDWSNLIHNNMLQDGYNLDAIDETVGDIKAVLNKPNYKVAIYMPLAITNAGFAGWGSVNGTALDFANNADRITALNWMIDESISAFRAKNYKNIELYGFYYIDEALREGDEAIIPSVTAYANSKGMKTLWAPYSDARGTNQLEYERGNQPLWNKYSQKLFDDVTYQINYFPGREDLPAAREIGYIEYISGNAKLHGASIEMELCGCTKENISGLKEYFKGSIDYGFMNNSVLSWWIASDLKAVDYLARSSDKYIRSTYDEMYKFINKTLKKSDLNMTQDYEVYVALGTGKNNAPKVQVVTEYNNTSDMVMVMQSEGGNNIFNISSPLKISAGRDYTDTSAMNSALSSASYLIDSTGTSDWFGPHKVIAVNNGDGDQPGYWGYQGGAHSYNNTEDTSYSATGRSANVRVIADGVTHTDSFSGPADSVAICWDVYVQAMNTVKEDGSGREVLIEHHKMSWDGDKWIADTDIEFLEDVRWVTYYGLQVVCGNNWNGEISYDNSSTWTSINGANISTSSNHKYTEIMTIRKNGHYLEMYMDSSFGIGDRRYLTDNASGAFSRSYSDFGKAYFNLVDNGVTIQGGTHAQYRGYYNFYTK